MSDGEQASRVYAVLNRFARVEKYRYKKTRYLIQTILHQQDVCSDTR